MDETGDPTELQDNAVVSETLQTDALVLDGANHSTPSGFEYNAIVYAVEDAAGVQFYVDVQVLEFGFLGGALALKFEGERTSTTLVDGIAVTLQASALSETDDFTIERATAQRDACD